MDERRGRMRRIRVEVDLNSRDGNGQTRARISNADGALQPGQIVTAFESEDQVQALAIVDRVDESSGYVTLTLNWDSMCNDDGVEVQPAWHNATAVAMNRAYALQTNRRATSQIQSLSTGAARISLRTRVS